MLADAKGAITMLTIGQLAGRADVGVETVRFYERKHTDHVLP